MEFGTPQFWVAAVEIIVINILLSGDNAVVIALACRNLPPRQKWLGIFWGVVGAVVLRIILTFFAVQLLQLPYLQLIGAVLLIWIGIKLIAEDEGDGPEIAASDRLMAAVKTVIVADLVMSIDNVIGVAGAAKGSLTLLIFGLVVSIPLVVVGSQLIMKLIERFPWLVVAGGGPPGLHRGRDRHRGRQPSSHGSPPTRRCSTTWRPRRASSSSSRSASGSRAGTGTP